MRIEDVLRKLVLPYREVRCGSPFLWVGSKWELTPYILPLYPIHKHSGDIYCGTTPFTFLKPPEWTPGMELINDWHTDLAGFLWTLQDIPKGTFEEFLEWWSKLPGGCEWLFNQFKIIYGDVELWQSLPLAQRSALWAKANRVRFVGRWQGKDFRNPGTYVGNWRSERKRKGTQLTRQCHEVHDDKRTLARHCQPIGNSSECRPRITPESWQWYKNRLARPNVEIRCTDALGKLLNEFNVKGMLFTIDPPYRGSAEFYGSERREDEQDAQLLDHLELIKGFFIAFLREWPELADLTRRERWMMIPTARVTSLGNIKQRKQFNEVVVMNYNPWEVERCCEIPLPTPLSEPTTLF